MFRQISVTIAAVMSSLFLLGAYGGLPAITAGADPRMAAVGSVVTSFAFAMAIVLILTGSARCFFGWRFWFRTLVGMGVQSLVVMAFVAIFRVEIDRAFIMLVCAIAVPTVFCISALLFAPKEKPVGQTATG